MTLATDRRRATMLLIGLALLGPAACTTGEPTPAQTTRTASETAPADLQLLCANAAAGAGGGNVLPVISRRIDATTYQVDLDVAGSRRSCVIDTGGNVLSMRPGAG